MTKSGGAGGTIVGVLGGIGPEATAEFYTKLFAALRAKHTIAKNTDYPQIVINSIPAPELLYEQISDSDLLPYVEGVRQLDQFGVDIIAMVCNTIHLYYGQLQQAVATPIINLPAEVEKHLKAEGIRKMCVLGTPNTISQGLYTIDGIENITLTAHHISDLSNAILNYNVGIDQLQQQRITESIAKAYLGFGAEKIVLGCTEIAVMLKGSNLPAVNTIDILADAVVRRLDGNG